MKKTGALRWLNLQCPPDAAAGCDPANAATDNPTPATNKTTLIESLLRIIATSAGDLASLI
jgi:hypothetical protein